MRKLTLLVALAACSSAWGAVAHIQGAAGFESGGTIHSNFTGACLGTDTSCTFSSTAGSTNNAFFFMLGCACASTTNVIGLTASGWTITSIPCTAATSCTSGTYGTSGNRVAAFWAYAPNTSAATFTANWAVSNGSFASDLLDEFSGTDGTNAVDVSKALASSGNCSTTVTPSVSNDGLWGACVDSATAVGSGYTKGGDDTQGDWSEWKILSGGSGAPQTVNFTGSGTYELIAVGIKPASSTVVRRRAAVIQSQ